MKLHLVIFLGLLCIALSEAWWGGSRSSSSSSSSSSWVRNSYNKAKNWGRNQYNYAKGFVNGAKEMGKAYKDMRKANTIGADKYFHAKGNYEAAKHGPGGKAAAKIISDARERVNGWSGSSAADSKADQEANEWGRNGGDPNKYRPKGLPNKYKREA